MLIFDIYAYGEDTKYSIPWNDSVSIEMVSFNTEYGEFNLCPVEHTVRKASGVTPRKVFNAIFQTTLKIGVIYGLATLIFWLIVLIERIVMSIVSGMVV